MWPLHVVWFDPVVSSRQNSVAILSSSLHYTMNASSFYGLVLPTNARIDVSQTQLASTGYEKGYEKRR
jgi:hypothetical protein